MLLLEPERSWIDVPKVSRRELFDAHGSFGRVLVVERVMRETSERRDAMTVALLRVDPNWV